MSTAKFDAALNLQLSKRQDGEENLLPVSVRLHAPLTPEEARTLQALGLDSADTRRRVLFGSLPAAKLPSLAALDKVARLSLVQAMAPKTLA